MTATAKSKSSIVPVDGVIRSQAVLIAIGINWEGRRQILAVELAHRESASSWKDFLLRLKARSLQHHKHLKSTNMLERLNEEIKRRTRVVRIFPNPASCLRLIRALCAETHEAWLEDNRYINMDLLKEQKKAAVKIAA